MKDAIGQELHKGSVVTYIGRYSGLPRVGTIVELHSDYDNIEHMGNSIVVGCNYKHIVNIHAQYLQEFPEKFI